MPHSEGIASSVNLILTTSISLLITSAVVAGGVPARIAFDSTDFKNMQNVDLFNRLLQSAYLSPPGTRISFRFQWYGNPIEIRNFDGMAKITFPLRSAQGWEGFKPADAASVIISTSLGESGLVIVYNLTITETILRGGPLTLTFSRTHEGIEIAAAR